MWALDKKPKIPMLVISMRTTIAIVRYDLIRNGVCFQLLYSHDTATSLPNSSEVPIMTTGQNAPAKIAVRPMIE
jgi:hypothetical protein